MAGLRGGLLVPGSTVSIETPAFAAMLRRMLRAYGRRVADADDVDLAEMVEMRAQLEEVIAAAVAGQIARGSSWSEIARGLGTTKQAAHKRYGRASVAG